MHPSDNQQESTSKLFFKSNKMSIHNYNLKYFSFKLFMFALKK